MSLSLYVCVWALARCVAISMFSKTPSRYYKAIGACTIYIKKIVIMVLIALSNIEGSHAPIQI